jgi:ABC-type branched-subunit amino acid transport system ATPase component
VVVLNSGQKVVEGTPREVAEDREVREIYFGKRR